MAKVDPEVEAAKEGGKFRAWRGADGKVKRIANKPKADAADDSAADDAPASSSKPTKKKPAAAADDDDALSTGAVVGIVVSVGLTLGAVAFGAYTWWKRRQASSTGSASSSAEDAAADDSASSTGLRLVGTDE